MTHAHTDYCCEERTCSRRTPAEGAPTTPEGWMMATGATCAKDGWTRSQNPHPKGTTVWSVWNDSWNAHAARR